MNRLKTEIGQMQMRHKGVEAKTGNESIIQGIMGVSFCCTGWWRGGETGENHAVVEP